MAVVQMRGGGGTVRRGDGWGMYSLCMGGGHGDGRREGRVFPAADTAIRGLWLMRRDGTGWGDVTRTKWVLCVYVCVRAGAGSELS